jgi:DNA-directed RNA polymerase subunit RPC12/RpoP
MMNTVPVSYVASVVSVQADMLEAFLTSVGGGRGGTAKATLKGLADVFLETVSEADLRQDSGMSRLRESDFCLLLVRHLDAFTLDAIRDLLRLLPSNAAHNLHVFICRQAGEVDYKISCSKCGQKLLVRDAMAMRRARCPHCQDFFQVPGQVDLVRAELLMPSNRMVRKIILGDLASCQQALEAVISHHAMRSAAAKSTTMRLDVMPES